MRTFLQERPPIQGLFVSPLLGAFIWLAFALTVRPGTTPVLLMASPFILVPLGLSLAARSDSGPGYLALRKIARLSPIVAISAALSFIPEEGTLAVAVSLPWVAFTGLIAAAGAARLLSRTTLLDPTISVDAGLIFIAVGGIWFAISRAGLNPMGFSDEIVQLTAVHFHYAGFALPIVAGFIAQRLDRTPLIPITVIAALPLTALGFTIGGTPEWLSASVMALAGLATAILLLRLSTREAGPARSLLAIAGLALMVGMCLAIGWSWSLQFNWDFLGLDSMAAIHGSLNALGFGLLGLIGLNILDVGNSQHGQINVHPSRPSIEMLKRLTIGAESQQPTNPPGLVDRAAPDGFKHQTWSRFIKHGDFDMACDALCEWRGHEAAGIKIWPLQPEIEVGTTLGLAIGAGPISLSATCRIANVIDEPDRFGFVYATLPHHPEDGEESFVISRTSSGELKVTVTAVWRQAALANHLFLPLTRLLQNRAIERYLMGIASPAVDLSRDSPVR